MIQQTIFPRVNTHIAAISKSYRFNGGTATVQVDSLGNYEVMVNGSRFSSQENSAKRDADYKPLSVTYLSRWFPQRYKIGVAITASFASNS